MLLAIVKTTDARPRQISAEFCQSFKNSIAIPQRACCFGPRLKGPHCARVAELVDALDSGSSTRKGVQVRVLSRAPSLFSIGSDSERARTFLLIYPHLAIFWPLFRSAAFFQPADRANVEAL